MLVSPTEVYFLPDFVVQLMSEQPQAIGVLFSVTQQVQPALRSEQRQSQHDWIISQHLASPLVQVMQTPLSVISHLHRPIVRLTVQTVRPLSVQQQLIQSERQLASLNAQRTDTAILLMQALGGGFQPSDSSTAAQTVAVNQAY